VFDIGRLQLLASGLLCLQCSPTAVVDCLLIPLQGLETLLYAVATLGLQPTRAWLDALLTSARQQLPAFSSDTMAMLLYSLARLQRGPTSPPAEAAGTGGGATMAAPLAPREWLAACLDRAGELLGSCSAQNLSNIVWAAARVCAPVTPAAAAL
jgi:hypothetical protein